MKDTESYKDQKTTEKAEKLISMCLNVMDRKKFRILFFFFKFYF